VRAYAGDVNGFDEVVGFHAQPTSPIHLTNEDLWGGDWAKGPSGTNETQWELGGADKWSFKTGVIAQSWEFPSPGTSIWHIRPGIHYWLNPASEASRLVAGRELTSADVLFTLNMLLTQPRSYLHLQPGLPTANITAPDKYTIQIKIDPLYSAAAIMRFGGFASIVPPEVVQKYGDMSQWQTAEGTGPFMLTDYVAGSSITLKRNTNYWDKDPVGPGKGNQLPYLDGVTYLIIPDASSSESAFRTGKIDMYGPDWETAGRLLKGIPSLQSGTSYFDGGFNTMINTKNPQFADVRVRRAMMMATDFNTQVKTIFGGTAQINVWPVTYNSQYANLYLPLDAADTPAEVKQLYTYNPDGAKKLLAEAGYPNGFKTSVVCTSSPAGNPNPSDYYSVLKQEWAQVGITLDIQPKDPAAMSSIQSSLSWTDLAYSTMGGLGTAYNATNFWGPGYANGSRVDDPYIGQQITAMLNAVSTKGQDAADPIHRELMKYVLAQAYAIPFPKSPTYRLWWPWLKNYQNEFSVGYWVEGSWAKWVWIDQDLKKSSGY
jgi:peptide/nickel transport system substrate-binding protein